MLGRFVALLVRMFGFRARGLLMHSFRAAEQGEYVCEEDKVTNLLGSTDLLGRRKRVISRRQDELCRLYPVITPFWKEMKPTKPQQGAQQSRIR